MNKYLSRACILYVICWTFFPFMQVGTLYRLLAIMFAGLWGLLFLLNKPAFLKENALFITGALILIIIFVVGRLFIGTGIVGAITRSMQMIIILVVGLMSKYVFKYDKPFVKSLFLILLLAICVFSITTTINVIQNPYAARIANSEWLEDRFEGNKMVGLYGFVYMCVFMEPMLLHLIQKKVRFSGIYNFLIRLAFVLIFIMVLFAGYMIAIFLLFGSCILMWSFAQKNFIKTGIALTLFVLFVINYETIVNGVFTYLMELFEDNPVYYNKFRDFRTMFLQGDLSGETVEGRFKNYGGSIKNIIQYPVLGCYFYSELPIGGGHSAFLDIMGQFGWLAVFLYVYLLVIHPQNFDGKQRKKMVLDYVVLICSIVFGIFDPYFQEIGIALYFVYPFVFLFPEGKTIDKTIEGERL